MDIKRALKAIAIVVGGLMVLMATYWPLMFLKQVLEPFLGLWFEVTLVALMLLGVTWALYDMLE